MYACWISVCLKYVDKKGDQDLSATRKYMIIKNEKQQQQNSNSQHKCTNTDILNSDLTISDSSQLQFPLHNEMSWKNLKPLRK